MNKNIFIWTEKSFFEQKHLVLNKKIFFWTKKSFFEKKQIVFLRFLGGNYPIFPKDTNKSATFKKRFYTFRAENEEIYLYAIYDHPGKFPFLIIANFHTSELSSTFSKKHRPQISVLYNEHMVGVDAFDQHVFAHTISRKVNKWPIRIIESCITFGLTNARAAYCIKNNIDFTKYSMKKFFLDILREHYPPVYRISKIKLEFWVLSPKYQRCIWTNCKKNTKTFCNNENCNKLACQDHMVILCCECFNSDPKNIITQIDCRKNSNTLCKIKNFCTVKSTVLCANESCRRFACANHRHNICKDCCIMQISSVSANYSEKVIPKKKFV